MHSISLFLFHTTLNILFHVPVNILIFHCQEASSSSSVLPHTLVYLSCGWEALRSEIDLLITSAGGREERDGVDCNTADPVDHHAAPTRATGADKYKHAKVHHDDHRQGGDVASWRLCHAESFLFFPGTDSIETLCVFSRNEGAIP